MSNTSLGYAVCPVEQRPALLTELVSRYWNATDKCWSKKVVILFANDNCVRFFVELFSRLKGFPILPVLRPQLHAKSGLDDYTVFREADSGMLATIPQTAFALPQFSADIIIQYDPPASIEVAEKSTELCSTYLLFLRPTEVGFIEHLKEKAKLTFEERYIPWEYIPKLPQLTLQDWYKTFHSMNINSKAAYKGYLDSVRDHELKDYFNVEDILLREVANGFCFAIPPYYKLVKEVSRYEQELQAKEQKHAQPLPVNAPVVRKSFKRLVRPDDTDYKARKELRRQEKKKTVVASDKNKSWALSQGVVYNPDGTVMLARDPELRYSLTKNRMRVNKAKLNALKKQIDLIPGMKKKKLLLKKMKRNR